MTDPLIEISAALARAAAIEKNDVTAASLATASRDGKPSVRMVLVKGVDPRGVVFYTNLGSRKARELTDNPHAALCLYWPTLGEQVRVEGTVSAVDAAEADAYFASRPRDSQIGAWASAQSQPLPNREALLGRVAELKSQFGEGPIPRPPFWSGFVVAPVRIEFWRVGDYRLHHRLQYEREGTAWRTLLLNP
jgi:pyridoxamine 5'-phosphate oxidase